MVDRSYCGSTYGCYGYNALLNPFVSSVTLMIFIGVVLMIEGASDLISIIRISGIIKRLKDSL